MTQRTLRCEVALMVLSRKTPIHCPHFIAENALPNFIAAGKAARWSCQENCHAGVATIDAFTTEQVR